MANLIRWQNAEAGTRWDRIRIYSSTTQTGSFTLAKELDSSYAWWWDETSPSTQWYNLTWLDSKALVESDHTDPFTTSSVLTTPKELRRFLAMKATDQPDDNELMSLILDANTEFQLDKTFSDIDPSKLALRLLSASYVCQWRAQQVLSNGNVNFAIDGVSVQRPFQFLMEQAKYWRAQYDELIWKFATESDISMPINDAGFPNQSLFLVDVVQGITNAAQLPDLKSTGTNMEDTAIIITP